MVSQREATIEDLYHAPEDGKYELVDGRLVHMSPTGARPGYVAGEIFFDLKLYQRQSHSGFAFGENVGFVVNLPNRRSFSPDAAYVYDAAIESDRFITGAPDFAVEVRSQEDYGPVMDTRYAAKRADYFAAGTRVVWDVNPRTRTISCYTPETANAPRIFGPGEVAEAEPALPGWRVSVDDLLR